MQKNIVKIILDTIMAVLLVLLYNSHVFAISFHEITGLVLAGLFIIHCSLNRKWIAAITKKFFGKEVKARTRFVYIVDVLLLMAFASVIISGICTSQALFPAALENKDSAWRTVHHFSAAMSLILVGIHVGMHWSFITGMLRKIAVVPSRISRALGLVLLAAMLIFGS